MKANPETGDFFLPNGMTLGRGTSLADFFAAKGEWEISWANQNENWRSFQLKKSGEPFVVSVFFQDEMLKILEFTAADAEFGTTWDDWSLEHEMARKRKNDTWLVSQGFSENESYSWGQIRSVYDSKSGGSFITVQYAPAAGSKSEMEPSIN